MNLLLASIIAIAAVTLSPKFSPVPHLPIPRGAAVILDTGSTNTSGYRIVVQRDGAAEYVIDHRRQKTQISKTATEAFFTALEAAMPLSSLASGHCMKSASFGSSTFAWWRGQRSPDLQCAAAPRATALYSSISGIVLELGLTHRVMRGLPTNEPRRPMPEPSPSSSM